MRIDAALIDLMIPNTESDLQDVDRWLVNRTHYSLIITSHGTTAQGISHAKQEAILKINSIDKEIAKLIVDDGGITFLQSEEAKRFFYGPAAVPVAIFSARTEATEDFEALRAKVKDALGGCDPDVWFVKPASSLDLEQWLKKRLPMASSTPSQG